MARVKASKTSVKKRKIAFFMFFLGVILTTAIGFLLFSLRQQGVTPFSNDYEKTVSEFQRAEKQYATLVTHIIEKKSPVSDVILEELETSYSAIENRVVATQESRETSQDELLVQISERKTALQALRRLNTLQQIEKTIGDNIIAFNACIKVISFSAKASVIYKALQTCTPNISAAQTYLLTLPDSLLPHCQLTHTPGYIVQKMKETHLSLIAYYSAVVKKEAHQAATTDQLYRAQAKNLQSLPQWNVCISMAITESSSLLKVTR